MIELRDYQKDLLTRVQSELQPDKARVMMQLPTGGGKTVIAAHLLKNWLVIGFQTWALTRSGEPPDTSIITASDPNETRWGRLSAPPTTASKALVDFPKSKGA